MKYVYIYIYIHTVSMIRPCFGLASMMDGLLQYLSDLRASCPRGLATLQLRISPPTAVEVQISCFLNHHLRHLMTALL